MPGIKISLTADEANIALAKFRRALQDTGAASVKTAAEIKNLEQRMLTTAANEKASKAMQDLGRMAGLTKHEIAGLSKELGIGANNLSMMEKTVRTLTPITVGLGKAFMQLSFAIMGAYGSYKMFISAPLSYLGKIESATLGIATSFMMNGKYIDIFTGKALEGTQALAAAQNDAKKMVEELQIANLETMATLEQLIVGYQQALPIAMSKGFSKEQAKNFTVAMIQAAGAIDPMLLHQLGEETRSLLMGTINPRTTRIATVMGLTSADNERIKKLDQEGKLYDWLMEKLKVYNIAGKASQETWAGLWSNFKDIIQMTAGKAFEPLFDEIKRWVKETTDSLFTIEESISKTGETIKKIKWNEDLTKGIEKFKEGLEDIIAYLRRVAMFLDLIGGGMALVGEGLARIQYLKDLATGNKEAGAARIKWFEEKGKMYMERANAQDIALLDMAMRKEKMRPLTKEEMMDMFAPPEMYNYQKWTTNAFGIPRYYAPETAAPTTRYVQNPRPNELDEKGEKLQEKLREEIEKMTHDIPALINLEEAKYLKEQPKLADLIHQWAATKRKVYGFEQEEKTLNVKQKTDKEMRKIEIDYDMFVADIAMRRFKRNTDLMQKEVDIKTVSFQTTEREGLLEKMGIEKSLLIQEQKGQEQKMRGSEELLSFEIEQMQMRIDTIKQDKLNMMLYKEKLMEYEKELDVLKKRKEIMDKQHADERQFMREEIDYLDERQKKELELADILKRKEYRQAIGFGDPEYKAYRQKERENIMKDMRERGISETGISAYKRVQERSERREELQYFMDNSENVWEVLQARQDMSLLESRNGVKEWATFYDNALSDIESAMGNFFDFTNEGFMKIDQLAKQVASSILNEFMKVMIIKPMVESGAAGLTSILRLLTGSTTVGGTEAMYTLPSYMGNVFSHGKVIPFKQGGVVSQKTYFPLGVMGENGSEAIVPLARDSKGNLGVKNVSGAQEPPVVVQMNINAIDAKSFANFAYQNKQVFANIVQAAIGDNHPMRTARR